MRHSPEQSGWAQLAGAGLLGAALAAVVSSLWTPGFDAASFVAAAATFTIALLTASYVTVTSRQLRVMERQLDEMAQTRELEAQPLPYLDVGRIFLERPRFFYSPPEQRYAANALLNVEYSIVNHGSHPAVNLIATAEVGFEAETGVVMRLGAEAVNLLGPNAEYPAQGAPAATFCSTRWPESRQLVAALRDRSFKEPVLLQPRLLYRNVLGACFQEVWLFRLVPRDEDGFAVLANWESELLSFEVKYKDELKELRAVQDKDAARWREVFDAVQQQLEASLAGGSELELDGFEIQNKYRAEVLEKADYASEAEGLSFAWRIPPWLVECPAADEHAEEA